MRRALMGLSLVAAIGGCTGENVALCEEQFRARCEFEFRCCDAEERLGTGFFISGFLGYISSEQECLDRVLPLCKGSASQDDAVAAGRLEVDDATAQGCIAALKEARDSCDAEAFFLHSSSSDEESACFGVTRGLVADGDACSSSSECAEGTCQISFDDPDINVELGTQDGECVGPAGVGEDCLERECDEGLTCSFEDVCVDLPGVGEPCPDFDCDEGLSCEFDETAGEDICIELPGLGEPCFFECADGFFCAADSLCAAQKGAGEACDPENFGECVDDAFCNESNTCESFGGGLPTDICKGN